MTRREVNKDKIKLAACTTDKDMASLARSFHISSAYIRDITERIKFKAVLCWKGENHTFYRHAKTRVQALSMAKRGLEKRLGLKSFILGAEFHLDYTDRCSCIPCICHTCKHFSKEYCVRDIDLTTPINPMYNCKDWEDRR
jgi:hypothetical protein